MSNLSKEITRLKEVVSNLERLSEESANKIYSNKHLIAELFSELEEEQVYTEILRFLAQTLRHASHGGFLSCLPEYPTERLLNDLQKTIYSRNFEFTQELSAGASFSN